MCMQFPTLPAPNGVRAKVIKLLAKFVLSRSRRRQFHSTMAAAVVGQRRGRSPERVYISPVDDWLRCTVCLDVLSDPVSLPACGHTFCRACAASVLGKPAHRKCPNCRTGPHCDFSCPKLDREDGRRRVACPLSLRHKRGGRRVGGGCCRLPRAVFPRRRGCARGDVQLRHRRVSVRWLRRGAAPRPGGGARRRVCARARARGARRARRVRGALGRGGGDGGVAARARLSAVERRGVPTQQPRVAAAPSQPAVGARPSVFSPVVVARHVFGGASDSSDTSDTDTG